MLVSISLHVRHCREGWESVPLIFTNCIDQGVAAVEDKQQPPTIVFDQGHIKATSNDLMQNTTPENEGYAQALCVHLIATFHFMLVKTLLVDFQNL